MSLHRVNTQDLLAKNELYYTRTKVTKLESSSKIEILPELSDFINDKELADLHANENVVHHRIDKLEQSLENLVIKIAKPKLVQMLFCPSARLALYLMSWVPS